MLLTDDERRRFAEYLEQDAASGEAILEQLAKLPGMDAIIRLTRAEVAASRIVAKKLRSTHSESIG